jgi:hypothetical protein
MKTMKITVRVVDEKDEVLGEYFTRIDTPPALATMSQALRRHGLTQLVTDFLAETSMKIVLAAKEMWK